MRLVTGCRATLRASNEAIMARSYGRRPPEAPPALPPTGPRWEILAMAARGRRVQRGGRRREMGGWGGEV